ESCCHWTRLRRRGATFFPYTTLFRSTEAVDPDSLNVQEVKLYQEQACDAAKLQTVLRGVPAAVACFMLEAGHRRRHPPQHRLQRSEEHTSELQALAYLVCRPRPETSN